MKNLLLFSFFLLFTACNQHSESLHQLQVQIDSLRHQLADTYTPGLGEFMSGIQIHHAKLWFAGISHNWKLADFEIKEIQETIEDIQKFNMDRPEIKSIGLIIPAVDSVNAAVQAQNIQLFESSYHFLTNTCNACHRVTDHEFNVIIIPLSPPVSNQRFAP